MIEKYDLIVVGSSFASSFFLHKYLSRADANKRVLVLERGGYQSHAWQIEQLRSSPLDGAGFYRNTALKHPWVSNLAFGGNSNCWWACTPRMFASDFELQSRYGVGRDWPLSYRDLEPYYDEAEQLMAVSGPDNSALYPGRKPYPLPPHRLNEPDRRLQAAYPGLYFAQPTARSSAASSTRARCCANGVCNLCPIDAKFTILNGMQEVYADERVELRLHAGVFNLEVQNDTVTGVNYIVEEHGERREATASAELVALGANALFNAHILLNSADDSPALGKGINEQVSFSVDVFLDGLDNYQGSTSITGHGYMFYDGAHRAEHAACIVEHSNIPRLRSEQGRWTQRMTLKFIFEDLPQERNRVTVDREDPGKVEVCYLGHSDYAERGVSRVRESKLPEMLSHLPVERVEIGELNPSEAHIMGAAVMGNDPETSVVSADLTHHKWRNLRVLGSGAFPSSAPVNPTLTLTALSLRSAERLFS